MLGPWRRRRRRRRCDRHQDTPCVPVTLDSLPIGARGLVLNINGERKLRRRMMEMGVLEGSRLRIVKLAPTGDPIQVKVNDYFLSIRRKDAATIVVQPTGNGNDPERNCR